MSPIDKIRKGILSNDMEQVTQGFKLLTGEEIRPEEGKPEEPSTEKAVQSPMQSLTKANENQSKLKRINLLTMVQKRWFQKTQNLKHQRLL